MTEVILLLFIGTMLIVLNVNAIKKEKKSFSSTLKDKEDNIKDYQIEIGQLRRELSETVLELQQEIEDLKLKKEANKNFTEEKFDDNLLEEKEAYKTLYNDEKAISKESEDEDFEQELRKELLKGIESMHSSKINKQDKNKAKYEDKELTAEVNENNVVEQGKDENEKKAVVQHEDIDEVENKDINEVNQQSESNDEIEEEVQSGNKIAEENEQKEIDEKEEKARVKNPVKKIDNSINNYDKTDENNKSNNNSVKVNEIKAMIDQGLSVDEISEKIGIGKGEVLLIKELYIK